MLSDKHVARFNLKILHIIFNAEPKRPVKITLRLRNTELAADPEVQAWLEAAAEHIWDAIREGRFNV